MARVTVEDCVLKIPNRFDLVMLAAQRARDITSGAVLSVERDNDKNPVVALREIADETIGLQELGEALIMGMQKHVESDEPEEDAPEFDVPSIPGMAMGEAGEVLVAEPQVAEPQVAEAQVAEPQVAEPQVAEPQVAEAQVEETADADDGLGEVTEADEGGPAEIPGAENVPDDKDEEAV